MSEENDNTGEAAQSHTLLIPLIGPMQAWGSRSRFDDRDTHAEPTKSGVLGLVCSAMGIGRGDAERLAQLNALRFGVRVDAPGRAMTDFHTAQEVIKASGGGTTTVTSRRHYLADARFLAGLESGDLAFLQTIEGGLRNPHWTLSLGRKSFPLTVPPFFPKPYFPDGSLRIGQDLETALQTEPWRKLRQQENVPNPFQFRAVMETRDRRNGHDALIADSPLSFEQRRFGLRAAKTEMVTPPNPQVGETWFTFPS